MSPAVVALTLGACGRVPSRPPSEGCAAPAAEVLVEKSFMESSLKQLSTAAPSFSPLQANLQLSGISNVYLTAANPNVQISGRQAPNSPPILSSYVTEIRRRLLHGLPMGCSRTPVHPLSMLSLLRPRGSCWRPDSRQHHGH